MLVKIVGWSFNKLGQVGIKSSPKSAIFNNRSTAAMLAYVLSKRVMLIFGDNKNVQLY